MKPLRSCLLLFTLSGLLGAAPAGAQIQLGEAARQLGLGKSAGPAEDKVAAGLKEALRVGADNAVKYTGRKDGYFANAAIKILMPKNLRPIEKGLRAVGYGPKVDEFILSMNRAAEQAAPEARLIFRDAILAMTFEDARKILQGSDTAATEYFQAHTSSRLSAAFRPIVEQAMREHGVTRQYEALIGQYESLPFMKGPTFDINEYVVSQALNGLFHMLGEEEKKIRKNPAARVTSLLKEVFGKR
ncbi:MAG: DUF4197 domain-containing protein [Acidobacteriia bacterium]|nr:DUF4197 domain-containing protein [Terriglobia bacterium]